MMLCAQLTARANRAWILIRYSLSLAVAKLLVENLPKLRPKVLDALLAHTVRVKVVRVKEALEAMKLEVAMSANRDGDAVKLVVSDAGAQVKVEVHQVFRGT